MQTKVYGPYDVLSTNSLAEGQPILTLPWPDVQGAQLLASLTDSNRNGVPNDAQSFLAFEIGIWGSFQGFESLIKRTAIRALTGPISYRFDTEESYDKVIIKARNMSGGRRGPTPAGVWTTANNCAATLAVFIQPRSGTPGFRSSAQR